MEKSLPFSVVQTLLASLQSPEIRDLFSIWGYKSKLEDLERTVETINSVLLRADSKQVLTLQQLNFIDNLKDVVYEADDLIDEFVTTVALQQQRQSHGKVREFFSSMNKLGFGYKMFRKVKKIREMLDRVADDAHNFSSKIDDLPIRNRREDSCSDVIVSSIVGRDDDQMRLVDVLLDPNTSQEHVSVVTIVGIGGLGKTTLAQLIYNDPRIEEEFPLRLWACVSDQDQEELEVKPILANILNSTPEMHIDELSLDQLLKKVHKKLDANKYLLVLDDLWNENHSDWLRLKEFLLTSRQRGNKILVTTRSQGTAVAVESSQVYQLQGLSDESSWSLFEMVVGNERANSPDLAEISRDIVKRCANVPLAIKVVGNLLYAQERNEWLSFQKSGLGKIGENKNDIMEILELSYRHLSPTLKSCFTYCALFPKGFDFDKETLLGHWMAQDYVKPLDKYDKIEDAAEEYFQILSRRSFFQDIFKKDQTVKFKIHDLMHDLAQQVSGKEFSIANSTTSTIDKRIRHLYDNSPDSRSRTQGFMVESKIRTYLTEYGHDNSQFPVSTLIAKWRSLRTLDLSHLGLRSLPDTIGQLLHLRYLDLCDNKDLKLLPISLTKLINMQFLDLRGCIMLKELPKDLSKLVNLRTLYVPKSLEYMPLGLARMTRLTRLNRFIVNPKKSCQKLEELRALRNLKGSLDIKVCGKFEHDKEYMGNTVGEHLNSISIEYLGTRDDKNDEHVLEYLQPYRNLKELRINHYSGVRMVGWAREDGLTRYLPNLVKIHLFDCSRLEELPWLGRLQHLKTLVLEYLEKVEYMENRSSSNDGVVASNSSTMLFFPSLEKLVLREMPKLKEWWRGMSNCTAGSGSRSRLGMGEDEIVNSNSSMLTPHAQTLFFHGLSELCIEGCPNLTSFPLCPFVEYLVLKDLNERFEGIIIKEEGEEMGVGSSSSSYNYGKIRHISTERLQHLKCPPMEAFRHLVKMTLEYDEDLKSLSEVKEVFRSCSSSLRCVILSDCKKLRRVCEGGLEYLTVLEELELRNLPELKFEETDMPWRSLARLHSLKLSSLDKVVSLPKGMRYLTALQTLEMEDVPLKEIPEWIECLSSLQSLKIKNCKSLESLPIEMKNLVSLKEFDLIECSDELKRRCEKPDGEYCPILNHIPTLTILNHKAKGNGCYLFGTHPLKNSKEADECDAIVVNYGSETGITLKLGNMHGQISSILKIIHVLSFVRCLGTFFIDNRSRPDILANLFSYFCF